MEYMAKAKIPHRAAGAHGAGVRGDQVNRGSRTFEGRFGRMFRALPAAEFDNGALEDLAWAMSAAPERQDPTAGTPGFSKPSASPETDEKFQDDEESGIPSGYTYLGQFIDHDITFDPASSLQKQNDPDGLVDFRTPALDLDCVYGRGPEDQPYMYESNGKKFLLGRQLTEGGTPVTGRTVPRDLPRFKGDIPNAKTRALIGDKRNDENVIVSQLQCVFLQFHNRLAGEMMTQNPDVEFKEIQRRVRWHYQYVVLNDFLPRIVGTKTMEKIWPNWRQGYCCDNQPNLCFYKFHDDPYIPIEFSAAAYRFGHSMIRPIYRLNTKINQPIANDDPGLTGRFFIFAGVQERGLNGFDEFPSHWAIDWSLYFDIKHLDANGESTDGGITRVQPAYKIDTSIVNPLAFLPEFSDENSFDVKGAALTLGNSPRDNLRPQEHSHRSPSNLAIRNFWRGNSMGLPSGQDVARAMGETVIEDKDLLIGKAQADDTHKTGDFQSLNDFTFKIKDTDPEKRVQNAFVGKAPLWYYVLAEAQLAWRKLAVNAKDADEANRLPVTLGPVGGRIVAETLIGLLLADSHSYLNQDPKWVPEVGDKKEKFKMGDFIKYALDLKG